MKIVMTDQDGVVLDVNYQATLDECGFQRCRELSEELTLVPNSDTPVARLLNNFRNALGLQLTAAIGEKGAVIRWGTVCRHLMSIPNSILNDYCYKLAELFRKLEARGHCLVAIGDTATWIREGQTFEPKRRLFLLDNLREQTVGCYLRVSDAKGLAQINNDLFAEGSEMIRGLPLPTGLVAEDFNARYGIIIMNASGCSKTKGYQTLRQILETGYPDHEPLSFFMIGDGDSDIIQDPRVIHCAVGNATAAIKQTASFISEQPHTKGFLDCLAWIAQQ